jgi:hypothetical protein
MVTPLNARLTQPPPAPPFNARLTPPPLVGRGISAATQGVIVRKVRYEV